MAAERELRHGTAIAVAGFAALIRGPSGSGKSDLALRCLAMPPSWLASAPPLLVADDQTLLERQGQSIRVSAPGSIRGLIEVRGIGIAEVPSIAQAELVLIVDLVQPELVERMPEAGQRELVLGVALAQVDLAAFEATAAAKLLIALQRAASQKHPG